MGESEVQAGLDYKSKREGRREEGKKGRRERGEEERKKKRWRKESLYSLQQHFKIDKIYTTCESVGCTFRFTLSLQPQKLTLKNG